VRGDVPGWQQLPEQAGQTTAVSSCSSRWLPKAASASSISIRMSASCPRRCRDAGWILQVRETADFDVRCDRQDPVAQFELKPVHHRQHDDQRRDAEGNAGHRDQRYEGDERVAP